MKTVPDLLRHADPLREDSAHLDDARDRIRRTVIAAASVAPLRTTPRPPRRVVLSTVAAMAVVAVLALFVASGGQQTLQAAVRFEARLAELRPVPGLVVAQVATSRDVIYLHPEAVVTNDDVARSSVLQDGPDDFGVLVEFLPAGEQRLRQATTAHLGRLLAILIDGEVVIAPVIRSAIGDSAVISGAYTRAEAERIVAGIGRH